MVPLAGFSHLWRSWLQPCARGGLDFISCMSRFMSSITRVRFGRAPSNSALHLVFHMCHVVIMHASHFRPWFVPVWFVAVLQWSSHLIVFWPKASARLGPHMVAQMGSVQPHPISMCSLVSSSPQITHSRGTFIPRRIRLALTHITCAPHIAFHSPGVSLCRPPCDSMVHRSCLWFTVLCMGPNMLVLLFFIGYWHA